MNDRILLGFCVRMESDSFFVRGIDIDLVEAEVKFICVECSIDFVVACVVVFEIDSVFRCGPQINLVLLSRHKNWLEFRLDSNMT